MSQKVREIARKLALSPATVSKAIRGQSGEVSLETTKRVLNFCKENGYMTMSEASQILMRMRTQNSRKQIFVATVWGGVEVYDATFAGICQRLQDNRLYSSFFILNDQNTLANFPFEQAGAVIVLGRIDTKILEIFKTRQIPIVMVDNRANSLDSGAINSDNLEGTYNSIEMLIQLGHRRIAFLCLQHDRNFPTYTFAQRQAGYAAATSSNGLMHDPDLLVVGYAEQSKGYRYDLSDCVADIRKLAMRIAELNPRPTAVVTANDLMGYVLRDYLEEKGIRVPRDISIVGYDGLHKLPNRPSGFAPVSTRIVNWHEIGCAAVDMALELFTTTDQQPRYVQIPTVYEDAGTVAKAVI